MACPYCGTHADWYKLDDGRSRCPGCYATTNTDDDERAAKEELESRDSTDKATSAPSLIADDVPVGKTESKGKAEAPPQPSGKTRSK